MTATTTTDDELTAEDLANARRAARLLLDLGICDSQDERNALHAISDRADERAGAIWKRSAETAQERRAGDDG